ncbi:MAG TPA: hypothetical protein P5248_04650, partial [Bacteroidales bacterium]|nr:hypothetical protein [Bacteroidales bacterium]
DGGGISPDIEAGTAVLSAATRALLRNFAIFDYATSFKQQNASISSPETFQMSAGVFEDFRQFVGKGDYSFANRTEELLKEMEKEAESEDIRETLDPAIQSIRSSLEERKLREIDLNREEISRALRLEIVARYHYDKGRVISALSDDPDVLKAVQVLNDPVAYQRVFALQP